MEKTQARPQSKGKKRIWWELDADIVRLAKLEQAATDTKIGVSISERLRESYQRRPVPAPSN